MLEKMHAIVGKLISLYKTVWMSMLVCHFVICEFLIGFLSKHLKGVVYIFLKAHYVSKQ